MPMLRLATLYPRHPSLDIGPARIQFTGPAQGWRAIVAGLCFRRRLTYGQCASIATRVALALTLLALPTCSELAQPAEPVPPGPPPSYVAVAARHLQSVLKDRAAYDGFEISGPHWVHALKGWSWLACVHFQDHGHRRTYALFIQGDAVVDGRYAVLTDQCDSQAYTQFDLATGALGRPTVPEREPLY
jgi:hypothetical protein